MVQFVWYAFFIVNVDLKYLKVVKVDWTEYD